MPSSHRLATLDALRGVAALSIIVFHLRPPLNPALWMSHAYLAVDLFFLLSGFVLDKTYALRLQEKKITTSSFILSRAIRLYPLLFLGAILSIVAQLFGNYFGINYYSTSHFVRSSLSIFSALPLYWQPRAFLFDLNTPVWSLFFEGILSITFTFFSRARVPALSAFVGLNAVLFAVAIMHYGGASLGPQWSGVLGGFPRAFFSFYLGVLMSRRVVAGPELPSFVALLAPGLLMAVLAISPSELYTPAWDALCVFFLLPALLLVSAKAEPKIFSTAFRFLGLISYCMYIIHYPIRRAIEQSIPIIFGQLSPIYCVMVAILTISTITILSWLILIIYDLPVRAYLSGKFLQNSQNMHSATWHSAEPHLEPQAE